MIFTQRNALIASIAIIVIGVGGWYAFSRMNETSPSVQTEVPPTFESSSTESVAQATSTEEATDASTEIDTSAWKTYREPAFGFAMQYPPEWGDSSPTFGVGTIDDYGYWKHRIGETYWNNDYIELRITVRKAEMTLEEMNDEIRRSYGDEATTVNGLAALRWGHLDTKDVESSDPNLRYQIQDHILMQDGDLFYGISFNASSDSEEMTTRIGREWGEVLKSFKTFSVGQ